MVLMQLVIAIVVIARIPFYRAGITKVWYAISTDGGPKLHLGGPRSKFIAASVQDTNGM